MFGLIDSKGVDRAALNAAAVRVLGKTPTLVSADPRLVMGMVPNGRLTAQVLESRQSILVFDGRVDSPLSGTPASQLAASLFGVDLLEEVMSRDGPQGLADLAADFALARFDRSKQKLVLSRDVFGLRPLYWANDSRRFGFSSDPALLIELGLGSSELDASIVSRYLSIGDYWGARTAFLGIRRVLGGRWVESDLEGRTRFGRWFRPEDVEEENRSLSDFAEEAADTIGKACAARTAGRKTTLLLSGGRDSGSVAVALARSGQSVSCLTQNFDPDLGCNEDGPAKELAESLGHEWSAFHTPNIATQAQIDELPSLYETPLGMQAFPQAFALRDAAREIGGEVVVDGLGGEPLFHATPVALLDLVRRGKLLPAFKAGRAYRHNWIYSYRNSAKEILRALAPGWIVNAREQRRSRPPWVRADEDPAPPVINRSSRARLVAGLLKLSGGPVGELFHRLFSSIGQEYAPPLLDQRVVRLALTLPTQMRIPIPGPKPVLARGLLGRFDVSRIKVVQTPYFQRAGQRMLGEFPELFVTDNAAAHTGLVHSAGLVSLGKEQRWLPAILPLANVEIWLRERT